MKVDKADTLFQIVGVKFLRTYTYSVVYASHPYLALESRGKHRNPEGLFPKDSLKGKTDTVIFQYQSCQLFKFVTVHHSFASAVESAVSGTTSGG